MYNAPSNGLAEAFNKTLKNLLKKVVANQKEIGMRESEKLSGHIEQLIEHHPKLLLIHWFTG